MVLSDAIEDYRHYARHELRHSDTTCYSYTSWHRNFASWLQEQGLGDPTVQELSLPLLRRYSYALSSRNLRPRTLRGALHALRSLFAFLIEMEAVTGNPAAELRLPKKDAAQRLLVNDEDLEKLLEASGRQRTEFRCTRDRAVLAVLIFCALRRQELLDLTVTSVNLTAGSLLVEHGKGDKSRTIFLCDEAKQALREWLALRQQANYRHDRLFVTDARQPFGENSLAHMLEEIKAIAGLKGDPRVKPHSIRHAAATRLLRNGADIRSIQTFLGHSQLQTTAIYLHTDEEQVRRIAPLAGFRPTPDPSAREQDAPEYRTRLGRSSSRHLNRRSAR